MAEVRLYRLQNPDLGRSAEEIAALPAGLFLFSETAVAGYEDIHTIQNLAALAHFADRDFDFVRALIADLVMEESTITTPLDDFAGMAEADQQVAAAWMVVPKTLRLTVAGVTPDKERAAWAWLLDATKVAREMRKKHAKHVISYDMSSAESDAFFADVAMLLDAWVEVNAQGFIYWLTNQAFTPFEFAGFAEAGYFTPERLELLNDILVLGNYNTEDVKL